MVFAFDENGVRNAKMKVVGVGGAGGNAVNRMIDEELEGVEFIAVNTDAQTLKESGAHIRVQIGKELTRGLGAGARPEIGRQAISESSEEIRSVIAGADLVFVTAGMGGGTGTGAAPIIGGMAREMGSLCIAIVTRPFHFEGKKRMRHAEIGLRELRRAVDTMIVVPNERLLAVVGKEMTFRQALKKADEVLLQATQGISDLISVTGEVNVDFADVRTVMSNRGAALMGTGSATGEDRAVEAAQQAICSPLLDNVSINGATGVLINISGGPDLTIDEVTTINSIIQEAAGDEGEMIFGVVHDPRLEGKLRVTVIATGFGDMVEDEPVPVAERVISARKPSPRSPATPVVIGSKYERPNVFDDRSAPPTQPESEPVEAPVEVKQAGIAFEALAAEEPAGEPAVGPVFEPTADAATEPEPKPESEAEPEPALEVPVSEGSMPEGVGYEAEPATPDPAAEEVTAEVEPDVPDRDAWTDTRVEFEDLEIPTFIRRQMD
ncbi:cell division protein FtsZ [Candidatus Palauibacter sp.]|uniref:cell division protein FtsZ n=1 Tax=Candidatus Palauibacter sp. TaxID=3101350 RepID=UPI003B023FDA